MKRFLTTVLITGAIALGIFNNLSLERRRAMEGFWKQVTLPYRLAKLAVQPPDEVVLMPVHGVRVRQVVDTWGAPRHGSRRHEGQDIFAPRGTPIYSATHGIVTRMTDRGIGGIALFITGAGGRRYYYAHLDRYAEGIQVGDVVTPDTVVGYVGNTGNARYTPPHLHFGIYGAEGALNPLPLMANRGAGTQPGSVHTGEAARSRTPGT